MHEHGASLFVQLLHGGREQISSSPKPPAVAPSAVPSLRFKSEPRALTLSEIKNIIAGYGASARLAAEGGLDGIEVSMAHGYLPAQFLSPLSNRRGDGYDGSLAGAAALLAGGAATRSAPRSAITWRSACACRPTSSRPVASTWSSQPRSPRRLHREGLVDLISLVLGHSAFPAASTFIAPPPPVPANAIALPAKAIRDAVPGATLLATTRVVDLAAADELVADGIADLVGMTRALIADPDLVAKTAGRPPDEVIECVGCNQACIGHYHAGVPIGCAVNARTGRERTLPDADSAAVGPSGAGHRRRPGRMRRRDRGGRRRRRMSRCSSASPSSAASSAWPAWPRPTPSCGSATTAPPPPACAPPASTVQLHTEAAADAAARLRHGRAGHRRPPLPAGRDRAAGRVRLGM